LFVFGELRGEPDGAFERAGLGDASLTTLWDAVVEYRRQAKRRLSSGALCANPALP
jgi:hypothetical protein